MPHLQDISVTILTKNAARYLAAVLSSVTRFKEVLILDSGSTDDTLVIAKGFPNVTVYTQEFLGFGPQHNKATSLASKDWILSIDADEVLSPDLVDEIEALPLDRHKVYSLLRHNHFNGKWIRHCGWHKEFRRSLYHRGCTQFSDDAVHEKIIISSGMQEKRLKAPLNHYPYDSIQDFLCKMERYSTLFALQRQGKKKASLLDAISHGVWAFFKTYILKRGFLDGYEGWVISAYNGHTAYYKYLKLCEANRTLARQ